MKSVNLLTLILVIVGGINWGLVGVAQLVRTLRAIGPRADKHNVSPTEPCYAGKRTDFLPWANWRGWMCAPVSPMLGPTSQKSRYVAGRTHRAIRSSSHRVLIRGHG